MERLTEAELIDSLKEHERDCRKCREKICSYSSKHFHCLQEKDIKAYRELQEYRNLEEQGMLVKLPCKAGDTLWTNCRMQGWYFRLKNAPYRVQVVFIGLNNSDEMGGGLLNVSYEEHSHMMQFNFSDIGKTVFLTKEAAEATLKEMEK